MNQPRSSKKVSRIPPDLLLHAYQSAVFPMGMADGSIGWFSPDPRAIIPLEPGEFHVSDTLAKTVRRGVFEIRINTAFSAVIEACASRDETWIAPIIRASYTELHRLGFAHSVECWRNSQLAGGLYGVSLGSAFFGESMFHWQTDASKVALVALVQRLRDRRFTLLDTQWTTPHLVKFGAKNIPMNDYKTRLDAAVHASAIFFP